MAYERQMDYIDVASRLADMREKFPELTMRQAKMEFVNIAGRDFVVYTAEAWRTPDDLCPGVGTAWEPIPGPTPYTRDSEVQNAETAAWGRALVAIGANTKNGIASHEEVTNRSGNDQPRQSRPSTPPKTDDPRIEAILKAAEQTDDSFVHSLATQYTQRGTLTEKQIASGFEKAAKILGNQTITTPLVKTEEPPMREYDFSEPEERF